MLSGRSRRLPPPVRTRVAGRGTAPAPATAATTAATDVIAPRPNSPLRTHIHPFPLAPRSAAPGPRRLRLLAPAAAPIVAVSPAAPTHRHAPTTGARQVLRVALRALIPPALLFVALVVPPQSLRATLDTLLIIAALGLLVWRLPMADEE